MSWMSRLRSARTLVMPVIVALLSTAACTRPNGVPSEAETPAAQAPFQDPEITPGTPSPQSASASQGTASPDGNLPFHSSQTLPPGTLLTVRLNESINAGGPLSKEDFEAIVAEPVVVDGAMLIPRGATVVGRVQSTRISNIKPDRRYVRLILESVHSGQSEVHLQTASLYARQIPAGDESDPLIHLEKGRRLTFRLTESAFLGPQNTASTR